MTAELGHMALIVALALAITQAIVPLIGSFSGHRSWMRLGHSLALGQLVFVAISFTCLANAFLQDDFSLRYVASNSNTLLPPRYKFSAVWGAHEGSLLLWALILAGWSAAVAVFSRGLPLLLSARVLAVLGMIATGFELFLLLTSNPFERLLPFPPAQGNDLNPLLQDIGLILHPPLLYMGYVGFSVPFAFAIAALIGGQFDSAWARWSRPWTNAAWMFLTIGITLGSWWAYYELGWGGWWFWDPVENASFMPWLVGTALVHSLAATEKRGVFRSWTLLLAIFAFSLSLLGTFLVRSGVLTSVHAFASDPERGVFILTFLGIVIGGSLLLFALRGPTVRSASAFDFWSREMLLLLNNLFLVSAMTMVLIGTLYPLVADVLDLGKISVGPPYFNLFFVPLMVLLSLCLGIAMHSNWRKTDIAPLLRAGRWPFVISLVAALCLPLIADRYSVGAALTLFAGFWVICLCASDVAAKIRRGGSPGYGLRRLSAGYWGMQIAHFGFAVCVLGAGLSAAYDHQRDVRMQPGDSLEMGGYQFEFSKLETIQGPNYRASRGEFVVSRNGARVAVMHPEKRSYLAGGQVMTEAAIDPGLTRDLYISLGEPLQGDAWALRLHVKPWVRCLWLGGLLIAFGGFAAALDKRYRRLRVPQQKSAAVAGAMRSDP